MREGVAVAHGDLHKAEQLCHVEEREKIFDAHVTEQFGRPYNGRQLGEERARLKQRVKAVRAESDNQQFLRLLPFGEDREPGWVGCRHLLARHPGNKTDAYLAARAV